MAVKIPDSAILGTRDPRASMSFAPVPTDPVGGAVSRVGGALMGLSAQLHEEEQRSKAFDADFRYLKFEQAWSDELARRSQEAPAGAEGFTETLRRDFDAQAQEFYRSIPDELADRYHTKLTDLNGRLMDRAGRFEQKSRHDFAVVQLGDAENSLVDRAMSDPSQYERALNEAEVLIQNAPLDGIEKEVRARQLRERFAAADVQRRATEGDYEVIGALRGEPGTVDRIIQIESGGNPNAKNPKSSATGLGQFIDSTWLGVVRKHAPHLMEGRSNAEVLALRTDPDIARRMLEAHTDDNREFLRNRGIEATDGNLYLAHFLGAGGAVRVLSEDPNASVEQVLGANVAAANPFLKGRTVGQLIDWASTKMGEAKPSGPVPSRYDAIPWEDRQRLADRVEARQRQDFARREAEYLSGLEDYVSYLRDGNAPTGQFTAADIAQNVSPEKAPQVVEAVQRAEAYGSDYASIKWATPAEVTEVVAGRVAELASPEDYRANRGDIASLTQAIEARNKALAADPAKYVLQSEEIQPLFRRAIEAPDDPVAARQYADATLAEQARLGVPQTQRRIMPAEQIAATVEQIRTATNEGQNMARTMQVMQRQWGNHWPQVHSEIAKELPGAAMVIGTMTRPDQQLAAERLAEAAKVGKGEYEKMLEQGERTDLQREVTSGLSPFLSTLINNPGGMETYGTVAESVYLLALANRAGGASVSRAVRTAVNDVLGKAYQFDGTYRVPTEIDARAVRNGAARVLENLDTLDMDLPVSIMGLEEADTRAAYVDALKANGFFVTAPDESGLVLYEGSTRSAVTIDGEPVVFTWEELMSGAPIPADLAPDQLVVP